MAKELIEYKGKFYFYDDADGRFYRVNIDVELHPEPELVKACVEQHTELALAKKR